VGNLGDITRRAIEALSDADVVFCEDTRRARILLNSLAISKELRSLHGYNERRRIGEALRLLDDGKRIVYICDSGTPGISDPGASLVRAAQENGFAATVMPGPTAFVPALIMSGLPCDKFAFMGFMPASPTKRRRLLRGVVGIEFTLIFYEAPHRIIKALDDCHAILGDRKCAIVREISKIHEEVLQGNISEMVAHFGRTKPIGEIVLIISGANL